MHTATVTHNGPVEARSSFPLPDSPQTANARQRASYAPERDIQLTGKGIAYCERFDRPAIERRIERHLALVTALLAVLDDADGDPDVEADEDFEPQTSSMFIGNRLFLDLELDDSDREPSEPGLAHPNGAHLPGGGSGI